MRIMVIEDDVEMANLLRLILSASHEVEVCTEKAHAIREAQARLEEGLDPDVVVIDLIINGTGGVEFYHWMRRQGYDMPVMFLTGCHRQSPEYRAAAATGEPIYEKDHFAAHAFLEKVAERVEAERASDAAQKAAERVEAERASDAPQKAAV